jgi:aspartyl-tRNA(Asn)/glutamyl-tRNA(Gln) amidotransferase subunit A
MSLLLPPLAEAAEEPLRKSLSELASDLAMGRLSSRQLVSLCLGQVEKLDHQIKAWVMVDQAGALAAADESDERRSKGRPRSELDGIPFGVKDIIDVAGWPTVAGFEPWKNKIARTDAAIVAQMRSLGMIPLGKTVTTQFASIDPPATQNPWNFAHTPGGSSSGSCAAVACRMVPLALGSQTGGSINRPASFCGVVGLKMAYGEWPVQGVVPCSPSLDTLGPILTRVSDLPLLLENMTGRFESESYRKSLENGLGGNRNSPLRIARLTGRFNELAEPEMMAAVDTIENRLQKGGCQVEAIDGSAVFNDRLWQVHRTIMMSECFYTHEKWFAEHEAHYLPKISGWVKTGREIPESEYHKMATERGQFIHNFQKLFNDFDAILVPAARGAAPTPETTGDPVLNAPWTLLGVPSLTVPAMLSKNGLPLGVQIVATRFGGTGFGRMLATGIMADSNEIHE